MYQHKYPENEHHDPSQSWASGHILDPQEAQLYLPSNSTIKATTGNLSRSPVPKSVQATPVSPQQKSKPAEHKSFAGGQALPIPQHKQFIQEKLPLASQKPQQHILQEKWV